MALDLNKLQSLTARLAGANHHTLSGLSKSLFTYLEREAAENPRYASLLAEVPSHEPFKSANGATDGDFWSLPDNPESLAFALFYWIARGEYFPMSLYAERNFDQMAYRFVGDFEPLLTEALNEILAAEPPRFTQRTPFSTGEPTVTQHHTHFHAPVGNVVTSPQNSTVNQQQTNHGVSAGDLESLLRHFRDAKVSETDLFALSQAVKAEPTVKADGSLGEKVGAWAGGMMAKAATKTWNYASEKAWGYLIGGINAYYRIG